MEPSDSSELRSLTRRMAAGEDAAFRTFHAAYCGRLTRYLLVVSGDEELTHEALPEVFRRIVRHVRAFPDETVFWGWLTVLARSALADEARRRKRYGAALERLRAEPEPGTSGADPWAESLSAQLAALPEDERLLLEEKYFANRSVRDLAAQFQLSEKAVESRLGRIRQKLKAGLLSALRHEEPLRTRPTH